MTFRCARCDWRGEDDDAAAEHARETEHWRCVVCQRRSLTEHEEQTCQQCVGRVRTDLADILTAYALLEPRTVDGLTLLGDGTMQRHAHAYELDTWTLPVRDQIRDEWTNDPLPILPALVSWEDYIREHYSEPKGGTPTLSGVVDYLTVNLDSRLRIAETFPAFDEFAAEVRRHRSVVQHAAGLADVPVDGVATCAECNGDLVRVYRDVETPVVGRLARARKQIRDDDAARLGWRLACQAALAAGDAAPPRPWLPEPSLRVAQAVAGTDTEGRSDDWLCTICGATVSREDYAFRVLITRDECEGWAPLQLAAEMAKKPASLLRVWAHRGFIATQRHNGSVHVWWPDVRQRLSDAS